MKLFTLILIFSPFIWAQNHIKPPALCNNHPTIFLLNNIENQALSQKLIELSECDSNKEDFYLAIPQNKKNNFGVNILVTGRKDPNDHRPRKEKKPFKNLNIYFETRNEKTRGHIYYTGIQNAGAEFYFKKSDIFGNVSHTEDNYLLLHNMKYNLYKVNTKLLTIYPILQQSIVLNLHENEEDKFSQFADIRPVSIGAEIAFNKLKPGIRLSGALGPSIEFNNEINKNPTLTSFDKFNLRLAIDFGSKKRKVYPTPAKAWGP